MTIQYDYGYYVLCNDIQKSYVFQYNSVHSQAMLFLRHHGSYHLPCRILGHLHSRYLHHNLLLLIYMGTQEYSNPKYLPLVQPYLENTFYLNVASKL